VSAAVTGMAQKYSRAVPRDRQSRGTSKKVAARLAAGRHRELWIGLTLATLSGFLWFLGCTPFDLSGLSWFAMVPLLFVLDRAPSRKSASLLAWWTGTVAIGGGYYWMIELLSRFADLSLPAALLFYLVFSAYQGSVFLLFGWIVRTIQRRTPVPMILLAPLAGATAELVVPLIFPSHMAIVQAWHPLLIQIADLTGPIGVSALLLVVNGAIYDVLAQLREKQQPRWKLLASPAAAAVLVVAALAYGHFRMQHFDALSAAAPTLMVGVVQPNVPYNEKGLEHPEKAPGQLRALQDQSRNLEKSGAQLIVWSETAYPYSLTRDFHADFPESDRRRIFRGFNTPTVVGALTRGDSTLYNSALLIGRDGQVTGRYDKMRLLAFGETIPGVEHFPWLRGMVPEGFGNFTPGKDVTVLPLPTAGGAPWRVGAIICYEDILPGLLRRMGALHPDLFVNLTNDSWYGARAEPYQHLALAVFGSIEQRTSMVRAVNSGISAFIDANGRLVRQTEPIDPAVTPRPAESTLAAVPMLEAGHTMYAKVGELFARVCGLCTVFLLLRAVYTRYPASPYD